MARTTAIESRSRVIYLTIVAIVLLFYFAGLWRKPEPTALDLGGAGLFFATLLSLALNAYSPQRFPWALLMAGASGTLMMGMDLLGLGSDEAGIAWEALLPTLVFLAVAIKGWDRLRNPPGTQDPRDL